MPLNPEGVRVFVTPSESDSFLCTFPVHNIYMYFESAYPYKGRTRLLIRAHLCIIYLERQPTHFLAKGKKKSAKTRFLL